MLEEIQADTHKKMDHSVDRMKAELAAVRTGRATAELLHPVTVEVYGTRMPLKELATLNTPDPQMIMVTPFDPDNVKAIEKAISSSNLGLNPISEGNVIRVPVPVLTEERRKELVKHVKHLGEDCKIVVRNVRRDANERMKKLEKDKEISQDAQKLALEKIQQETDKHIKSIDEIVSQKEKDLMTL